MAKKFEIGRNHFNKARLNLIKLEHASESPQKVIEVERFYLKKWFKFY